jgi:tight adherence protein C
MDIWEWITNPRNVAMLLAAVAAFATVWTIVSPMFMDNRMGARLKEVAKRREEMRRKSRAELENKEHRLVREDASQMMQNVVRGLKLDRYLNDDTLANKLARAGMRGPAAVTTYYFYRFSLPIGLTIGTFIYLVLLGFGDRFGFNFQQNLIAIVGSAVVGFYAPSIYVSNVAAKRKEAIMRAFPDSLDMLLICVEAGMSIELALNRVGGEMAPASVELAEEFQLTCAELSYLPERRLAFENLAKRTNHPGVKSVAMALVQAEKYGTPLGGALRVMAKENRDLRMSEAEKKAASLPAKLTVPMIVFFLPVLFAVIMGPAMIQIFQMMNR